MNEEQIIGKGTFVAFKPRSFNRKQSERVRQINVVLSEYDRPLTARQLYYQLVARGLIDNNASEYERLIHILGEARLAGLVSWTAIEDRGRQLMGLETFDSPAQVLAEARDKYKRDMWENQPCRVEVWVEKQALEGVVGQICDELRVNFFATKGYNSLSEYYAAGRRFASYYQRGQRPVVLHLADHDPAGFDMTRDVEEKLELFTGTRVHVVRVGLNPHQVRLYNPPPQPAKEGDSKTSAYVAQYGEDCYELDAMPPGDLQEEIEKEVLRWRDQTRWAEMEKLEAANRNELATIVEELKDATGQEVDADRPEDDEG